MNVEQRLTTVADRYRSLGYRIALRPGPDELPPFAKDFHVEILASRADGNVLVSAKGSPSELEADPNVARYAELTERQPGWRFDLFVLGPDSQPFQELKNLADLSDQEIHRGLDEVERLLQAGFVAPSLVAAWATLESVLRRRLRVEGEPAGWGTSPRTMLNELYSGGILSTTVLRNLEGLFQLRSAIAHGFSIPSVSPSAVQFLVETTRRLLTESTPVKQPA